MNFSKYNRRPENFKESPGIKTHEINNSINNIAKLKRIREILQKKIKERVLDLILIFFGLNFFRFLALCEVLNSYMYVPTILLNTQIISEIFIFPIFFKG